MPTPKDERVRIRHMHDAALEAQGFMRGRTRADLDTDRMLALAVVRLLEIIGEAAKNVPPDIRDATPQLPWSQIARMRDHLAHGYFDVNLDRVWEVVSNDLPLLVAALEGVIASLPVEGNAAQ